MTGPKIAVFCGGYDVSREVGGFDPVNFLRGTGPPIPVREVGLLRGVALCWGRFDGLLSGSFS